MWRRVSSGLTWQFQYQMGSWTWARGRGCGCVNTGTELAVERLVNLFYNSKTYDSHSHIKYIVKTTSPKKTISRRRWSTPFSLQLYRLMHRREKLLMTLRHCGHLDLSFRTRYYRQHVAKLCFSCNNLFMLTIEWSRLDSGHDPMGPSISDNVTGWRYVGLNKSNQRSASFSGIVSVVTYYNHLIPSTLGSSTNTMCQPDNFTKDISIFPAHSSSLPQWYHWIL